MYREYNPNPVGRRVGDCAVRAIAKALDVDWETAYLKNIINGFQMGDVPPSDSVWGATLRELMEDAPDEKTRMEFQRFIQKIEKM